MANQLTGKFKVIDTASGSGNSNVVPIRQIQWIDDAGDIVDGDDLSITIDGATLAIKANLGSDVGREDLVIWSLGPFTPGWKVKGYVVNTIDHGVVVVVEE